jgi:hypothetical protein
MLLQREDEANHQRDRFHKPTHGNDEIDAINDFHGNDGDKKFSLRWIARKYRCIDQHVMK